jgi:protoheme IX farnesyltransferase
MSFTKFRLTFLVVLSAISGYLFVVDYANPEWLKKLLFLSFGGMLVTGSSTGMNQIIERDLDKKMKRTQNRALPSGRMNLKEAYTIVAIFLGLGTFFLYMCNPLTALLGVFSFVLYAFVYTPLKPITPWAVFAGAFPGALPTMIGVVAFDNHFGLIAGILFMVQFMWQFPHFWAIAWVAYDDYEHGGFYLLPSEGKTKASAFPGVVYALLLVPFSLLPWVLNMVGNATLLVASIAGLIFFLYAYKLYLTCETKDAKKLMFASFIYLPIIQFLYVFNRI